MVTKFCDSLKTGVYFDDFIPDGCVAIKQDALVDNSDAKMLCIGRLDSDFESFFNEAKE